MPARARDIAESFAQLASMGTEEDRFLCYVTNHGNSRGDGICTLNLYNEEIDEDAFRDIFNCAQRPIPFNFGLFLFMQCYSGGFAETIATIPNCIGISNSPRNKISYKDHNGPYLTYFLIPRIFKPGVDILEAFFAAAKKDAERNPHKEIPQMYFWDAYPETLFMNPVFSEDRKIEEEASESKRTGLASEKK
jgi:hypothetical protein